MYKMKRILRLTVPALVLLLLLSACTVQVRTEDGENSAQGESTGEKTSADASADAEQTPPGPGGEETSAETSAEDEMADVSFDERRVPYPRLAVYVQAVGRQCFFSRDAGAERGGTGGAGRGCPGRGGDG